MSKSDASFAKLLGMMRDQGSKDNPTTIELGEMTSPTTCTVGELELDEDDLLFNEMLLKPVLTELNFEIQNNGGVSHSHSWVDKSKYIEPLKKGDIVAVMRLFEPDEGDTKVDGGVADVKSGGQDTYIVLCKVVSAK